MNNTFKPRKQRMRASFSAAGTLGNIDKTNEVLFGVQVCLEGEALGHGVWLDKSFIHAVADAGNAMGEAGVKCRFGHPAMCSDALGTYLGRVKNFRVKDFVRANGETALGVVGDLYIAPESHSAPNGDLGKWVLDAAENSPDTFGQSIVFTYGDLKSTDENGEWIFRSSFKSDGEFDSARGENKVYAVLGKLLGTDFTDTPAATDGVFSSDTLAGEAEEMLSAHPEIKDVILSSPEKVVEFLSRLGLWEKLETKRIAGLQAAKDKQISALEEELKAKADEALTLSAKVVTLEESLAGLNTRYEEIASENKDLQSAAESCTRAFDLASADIKQLEEAEAALETSLAKTQAELSRQIELYRAQVGDAMQLPEEKPLLKDALAKCATPQERSALIASGNYR